MNKMLMMITITIIIIIIIIIIVRTIMIMMMLTKLANNMVANLEAGNMHQPVASATGASIPESLIP